MKAVKYTLRETLLNTYAIIVDSVTVGWSIQCEYDNLWYWCNVNGWKEKGQGYWPTPKEAADNFILKKSSKLAKRVESLKGKI